MGFMESLDRAATNLDSGGLFQLFNEGIFAQIYFFVKIFFWFAVVIIGGIAIYKFILQYKIKVTVKKRIGMDSVETIEDMAKIVTDEQGKTKMIFLKSKKGKERATAPLPEAKYKGKKGKFDHYTMWMDDNQDLHPIEPPKAEDNFDRMKIRPQVMSVWARQEMQLVHKKYEKKDTLLKYAAPAILLTACVVAFLIFFFGFKELGAGMSELASQFAQVASSCTKLG